MKIAILGSSGMLGQMATRYFKYSGYQVVTVNSRYSLTNRQNFFDELNVLNPDIILNCIGAIKQKVSSETELFTINALLPLDIINNVSLSQIIVQPSTDCVFNGLNGAPYETTQSPQAKDAYGYSKALGEQACKGRSNVLVFRVSIIGLDKNLYGKGLLNWFLSQEKRASVFGFTNHLWNGITTLEWCRQVEHAVIHSKTTKKMFGRIIQLGSPNYYTKYEMLELFNDVFETDHIITGIEHETSIDRRLVPDKIAADLRTQLLDMKAFWLNKVK